LHPPFQLPITRYIMFTEFLKNWKITVANIKKT
jgi:hypothetical protein